MVRSGLMIPGAGVRTLTNERKGCGCGEVEGGLRGREGGLEEGFSIWLSAARVGVMGLTEVKYALDVVEVVKVLVEPGGFILTRN